MAQTFTAGPQRVEHSIGQIIAESDQAFGLVSGDRQLHSELRIVATSPVDAFGEQHDVALSAIAAAADPDDEVRLVDERMREFQRVGGGGGGLGGVRPAMAAAEIFVRMRIGHFDLSASKSALVRRSAFSRIMPEAAAKVVLVQTTRADFEAARASDDYEAVSR
jgi:hypothetical protein